MNKIIVVVRGETEKLRVPAHVADGVLRCGNNILLNDDLIPADKRGWILSCIKAGNITTEIEAMAIRYGDNGNGLIAVWLDEVETHPLLSVYRAARDEQRKIDKDIEDNQVTIHLSTRGWGDYSSLVWSGDIRQADGDIISQCRELLVSGHDVDECNQTDDEIRARIAKARALHAAKPSREARRIADLAKLNQARENGGYCYNCETYCDGDCGNYQPRQISSHNMRDMRPDTVD